MEQNKLYLNESKSVEVPAVFSIGCRTFRFPLRAMLDKFLNNFSKL